jgi:hypothetical protein
MSRALVVLIVAVAAGCHRGDDAASRASPSAVSSAAAPVASDPGAVADGAILGIGHGGGHSGPGAPMMARVHVGAPKVDGRLAPEVVRRYVKRDLARFAACYHDGLVRDPKLGTGSVVTRFVVDARGAVGRVEKDASTTLADAEVVACVQRVFGSIPFPASDAGSANVVVSLSFAPP